MIMSREGLLKEKQEETVEYSSPAAKVVKALYSNELSGHNWAKLTVEGIKALVVSKAEELGLPANERHIMLLTRAIKNLKTKEDIIMKMETFLLGTPQ